MKRIALGVLFAALLVGACGGRVEDPGSGGSGNTEPTQPVSAGAAGKSGSSSSDPLPSHDLGDCKPGFERASNPGRSCNWLTESGTCFDTNDAACACICPPDGASVCFSGFYDGPGSATLVHCQ